MRKNTSVKEKEYNVAFIASDGKEVPIDLDKMNKLAEKHNTNMSIVTEAGTPQLTIKKAKITKDRTLDVEIHEHYSDGGYISATKQCDYLVHDDLREAFKKLVPHLIILCDMREIKIDKVKGADSPGFTASPDSYDLEELSHISVRGFSIVGSGDTEGVTLVGFKEKDGKTINMLSPFIKFEEQYPFASELISVLSECKHEVKEYLNGKHAQKQLEMEFDGEIEEIEMEE